MDGPSFSMGVIVGFSVGTALYLFLDATLAILKLVTRSLRRQLATGRAAIVARADKGLAAVFPAHAPAPEPEPPAAPDKWYALPGGNRLEYLDTGFAIVMDPTKVEAYSLYTPEGHLVTSAAWAFPLKGLGATMAAERAEFAPARRDQAGRAMPRFLVWIGSLAAIVLALGWAGPQIDHGPTYASYGYTPDADPVQEVRNSRAADMALCARLYGLHAVAVQLPDGQHRCADKHGRRLRDKVNLAQRGTP